MSVLIGSRRARAVHALAVALALCWGGGARAQQTGANAPQAASSDPGDASKSSDAQGAAPQGGGGASSSSASAGGGSDQLRPFCTDRPTKSNGACTVDKGHFQIESDLFNATIDHSSGGVTDTFLFTNPTLKYGVTDTADVEVSIAPYEEVRTHDGDVRSDLYGVGDLYLRAKVNLVGDAGGSFAASLFPYVKAPTARAGIGDGAWEGGLIVPLVIKLNDAFSLTFDPEVDVVKDSSSDGHHVGMAQLVDLSWSLPKQVTLYGELWSDVDFDPLRTTTQYTADVAASWGLPHDLQLDTGVNIGLNHETPAFQGYVGVSHRF